MHLIMAGKSNQELIVAGLYKMAWSFPFIFIGPALFIGALVGIFSPNGQVAGFIMGLIFVYWAYNTYQGRKHFPERLDKFKRTWYCFDCDKLSLTRK